MMAGYLRAENLYVQRSRVRGILNDIDSAGTAARWGKTISRRSYSVPTPNSPWHMDGHMKLIRYRSCV